MSKSVMIVAVMAVCRRLFPLALAAGGSADDRPNLVLILADDLGYGDVGCYGGEIATPHIDRLARRGLRFSQFYASAPECSPTRTALMSGRYPQRAGGLECAIGTGNVGRYDDAIRLRRTHELGLPAGQNRLIRSLKAAGYTTACIGKWHLGYEPQFLPLRHGFDYAFGPLGGGVDYFHHTEWDGTPVLFLNDKPVRREGYLTDLITEGAVGFLRQARKPFFLYVPYTAPHTPYQGPDDRPDKPRTEKGWNVGTPATYSRMVERLDAGVGAILNALRQAGAEDHTLVVFTSDNGPTRLGSTGPLSGHKSTLLEGGIRVPCIMSWPGRLPRGEATDEVGITMDLTASFVQLAGGGGPTDPPLDGIDILERVGSARPRSERTLCWRYRRGDRTWRAIRYGDVKYASRQDGSELVEYLFDLAQDPGEKSNLMTARPEEAVHLKALLAEWEQEVKATR